MAVKIKAHGIFWANDFKALLCPECATSSIKYLGREGFHEDAYNNFEEETFSFSCLKCYCEFEITKNA